MPYYLRMGPDYLEQAVGFKSKVAALGEFHATAHNLARYGQRVEASLHIADSKDALQEYPDFILSLGPRGGLRCERT